MKRHKKRFARFSLARAIVALGFQIRDQPRRFAMFSLRDKR